MKLIPTLLSIAITCFAASGCATTEYYTRHNEERNDKRYRFEERAPDYRYNEVPYRRNGMIRNRQFWR